MSTGAMWDEQTPNGFECIDTQLGPRRDIDFGDVKKTLATIIRQLSRRRR